MKSYRTLALKELLSQKVTSILILIAVVLSTMMTTIVGQSIGVLSAIAGTAGHRYRRKPICHFFADECRSASRTGTG